jgi:uncharacterized protein YybS (DUF2232 family)
MNVSVTADARESHEPRPWGPLGAAALAALLFSVWLVFPNFGLAVSVFSAFPIVIQRLRGSMPAVVSIIGSVVLIGGVFSFGHALVFVLLFALPGLLIGEAMARGHGLRRGCLWAFALLSLEVMTGLALSGSYMSKLIVDGIADYYSPQYLAWLGNWMPPDQVEKLSEQAKTFESAMLVVYPAVYVIMGGLLVAANAMLVRAYLARRDPAWLDGNEFEGLRLPFGVAVVFVLAGLSVFVPPARPLGYNVLLIVAFLLALQGLAVVLYYAHRLAGPPFLRRMVVVLVLVNPWAPQLLGLLGLFDLWFDFRRFADVPEQPK